MIQALQEAVLQLPQFQPDTQDFFHGGMYVRAVERPAGCLIVGKVHKRDHLYFVATGSVAVVGVEGEEPQIYHAPRLLQCQAGTKRAVYALTDALCFTIHVSDATTTEEAEAELVEPDETSPFLVGNRLPVKELT